MRKYLLFLLAPALLAGCAKDPAVQTSDPEVIARAGKAVLTRQDLENKIKWLPEEDRQFAQTPIGRMNFIQVLVREKLAEQAAKEAGLDKTDVYLTSLEDKRAELEQVYRNFAANLLERSWYEQLEESGATAVTEQEIKDYYKKYPYEMTVKQIIVDNAQTADEVLRALKNNRSRWKELARQYSVAPETVRDESFSFMPGEFLPEIEVIAANSPTGSVQGFIKTAQGFHIIMKTGEKRLSAKEAAPRIARILKDQKTDVILNNLKNKYEVVIYDKTE